jgi:glycosyltransferase involved in cell wall biosynthesis
VKICRITTISYILYTQLRFQIKTTVERGHDVVMVATRGAETDELIAFTGARFHEIEIKRMISIWSDLVSLFTLITFLRKNKFDIIHSCAQKAGLITAIAGFICRVPIRIHTYTGQPWVELQGLKRWITKMCDWLIAKLNTICYVDSPSQRAFLLSQGIGNKDQLTVLLEGSIAGVDFKQFDYAYRFKPEASQLRAKLGISKDSSVIIFVGRVVKDKGIVELVSAFRSLLSANFNVDLLIVGPFEPERDLLPADIIAEINESKRIHSVGFSYNPEQYLAISDIFCLPSYREGFGTSVVEAGALGIPSVGTRIVGLVDAIVEGDTGLLVPPKDSVALTNALTKMLREPDLRIKMGKKALDRAKAKFDSTVIANAVLDEYEKLSKRIN